MNWEVILLGLIAASVPGILSLLQNRNKSRAEAVLAVAQAEKVKAEEEGIRSETQNKLIKTLQDELCKQKAELKDIRDRLSLAEKRAEFAEGRILDYEKMSTTARSDIVRLGEELSRERKENQGKINKIALLVSRLIEQVKQLGGLPEITNDESALLDKLVVIGE